MFTTNSTVLSKDITSIFTNLSSTLGQTFNSRFNTLIKKLFANNEQGVFYDPFDMSTMYQDAAGINLVSSPAQPLGLMLDKSKGLTLGSESFIESNVTLTFQSTKISAGYYNISSTTDTSAVQTNIAGGNKWRVVEYEITRVGSGSIRIDYASGVNTALPSTLGRRKVYIYGDKVNFVRSTMPTDIDFKIYSIKELSGNHAYQTTSAARPIFIQKPVFGSNYVVNGTFTTDVSGWGTYLATATKKDNGVLLTTTVAGNPQLSQGMANAAGKTFLFSANFKNRTGTALSTKLTFYAAGYGDLGFKRSNADSGTLSFIATIPSAVTNGVLVCMMDNAVKGASVEFSDVRMVEIVSYLTDRNYIEYDGVDAKLLTTFAAPLNNCTVVRAVPNEGTKILYNQTLPASFEDTLNHAGFFAIDRALSNSEKVLLLNEMDKRTGITSLDSQVARLFANNEVGVAYDLNDMSTMFQDAAGTIPVTAAGQPVGLMLDKSKGLVFSTELTTNGNFNNGSVGWTLTNGSSVTSGALVLSSQYATADQAHNVINGDIIELSYSIVEVSGTPALFVSGSSYAGASISLNSSLGTYTIRFRVSDATKPLRLVQNNTDVTLKVDNVSVKKVLGNHAYQTASASRPVLRQSPILGNELIVNGDFSNGITGVSAKNSVTLSVTDGVLKVTNNNVLYGFAEMSFNTEIGKKYLLKVDVIASSGAGASFHVASTSNSSDILNNVDATTMAKGVVITATTAATYISLKVPTNVVGSWRTFDNVSAKELQGYYTDRNYLEFDDVDDFLQTNAIDFTSTDKVSVFAGVRKLSDAATRVVAELSATVDGNTGAFRLTAPTSGGLAYQYISRGSTAQLAAASVTNLAAPDSAVVSAKSDINADISSLRINGILTGTSASDQGTGNYGNHPLYIGRRAGTNLPFNGHLYSLIIMGRLASDAETTTLEKAIAKQIGVELNV